MPFVLRDRLVSGTVLALLLAITASCSMTPVQPSASPGNASLSWDQDLCRREGGVWRDWRCDYSFGTGGAR
jgi:hypothetical protein